MAVSIQKIGNDTELDKLLNRVFTSPLRAAYVEVGKNKHCLPVYYQDFEQRIRKFEVKDDDVYILGHPKTGTTWCHELVWMLINDLDYEGAKVHSIKRCPVLEVDAFYDFKKLGMDKDRLTLIDNMSSPRSIKSHLPWNLLPEQIQNGSKQTKVVLTFRDIKDTCISNYHQVRATEGYKGTFEEFCELYLGGRAPNTPFWPHAFSLWEQKGRLNVFVIRYEEMKANLPGTIRKVAKFLGKILTDEQLEKLANHLSFESMKQNPAVNMNAFMDRLDKKYEMTTAQTEFIRSGKVGDYKSLMTPAMIERFNRWIKENTDGTDFAYK